MEEMGTHRVSALYAPNYRVQATAFSLRFAAASRRA